MAICTHKDLYASNNTMKTISLVREFSPKEDKASWIFTIHNESPEGLISLKQLFMKFCVDDPSEAEFATEVFGDLGWWLKARETKAFKTAVDQWRHEADTLRKRKAFKAIMEEVESGKASFAAAKYLVEEPWKDKRKQAVRKQVSKSAEAGFNPLNDDLKRLKEEGFIQ